MKEYIDDKDEVLDENIWEMFFKRAIKASDIKSLHITSGMFDGKREEFDYITFEDKEYNVGTFGHMLIVKDENVVKGITRLELPFIQSNCSTYVVMSYNQSKQLFSREDYTIIKKGQSTFEYDDDKKELLQDSIRHTKTAKRNFDLEEELKKYTYFMKNVLPDFVTPDSEREL